jgi:hypothetical protein
MKATIILLLGLLITAAGVLFILQAANLVAWPRESFMIGQRDWIERGIVVVLIGLALILTARRIRQS